MEEERKRQPDFRDVVVQIVVGAVLGLLFLLAGWFAEGDIRALLFVASLLASGAAVGFAARTRSTLWAAIGGAVAATAVISAVALWATRDERPPPEPTPLAQASPAVAFEQPAEGAEVAFNGTTASGTLTGELSDDQSLWLFITSPDAGGVHYISDRVGVADSAWSVPTGQVGADDPSEVGRAFVLEVVLADADAAAAFDGAIAVDNWEGWSEFPNGAEVVATRSVVRAPERLSVEIASIESRDGLPGISSAQGYRAFGVARGLQAGESLWLMDKDDVGYTIAEELTMAGHEWSAESYPVGDEGTDLPFTMGAAVVKADQQCASALRVEIDTDDSWLPGLPGGCLEMDSESLVVARA